MNGECWHPCGDDVFRVRTRAAVTLPCAPTSVPLRVVCRTARSAIIYAMEPRDRLVVALDLSTRDQILRMADELRDVVGMMKVGLQAFVANGPDLVRELQDRGHRVFLDLKLHDIPNTVASAVAEGERLGVDLMTIHAAGGGRMIRAARAACEEGGKVRILAVTMLTSIAEEELTETGLAGSMASNVVVLAELAQHSGAHGVVASPREIRSIRERAGKEFVILTPGIRGATDTADDQRRTTTAAEAIAAGADYIVVGRPITRAAVPRDAAMRIVDSMTDGV